MKANEEVFGLNRIKSAKIENFIKYYGVDQLTEHDDTDFDDCGDTVKSPVVIGRYYDSSDEDAGAW